MSDRPTGSASSESALASDPDTNKRRAKTKRATVACTACRKRQVKCSKGPSGPDCMRCYKMKLKCEYIPIGQHKLASSSTFEASTPSPTTPDMPFRADLYNTSPSGQWVTPAGGGDQVFVAQPAATGVPALAYEQHATAPFASGTGSRRISANYSTAPPWVSASLPARSYSPAPAHPAYALAGPGERPEAWMGTRLSYPVSQSTPSSPAAEERGYPPGQQAVEGGLAHWRQQPPAASQWREGASAGTLGGTGAALQTAYPARVDPSPATQQYYPHTGWTQPDTRIQDPQSARYGQGGPEYSSGFPATSEYTDSSPEDQADAQLGQPRRY